MKADDDDDSLNQFKGNCNIIEYKHNLIGKWFALKDLYKHAHDPFLYYVFSTQTQKS